MNNISNLFINKCNEIQLLKDNAENQKALTEIENVLLLKSLDTDERLKAMLLKGEILYNLGYFEELLLLSKNISEETEITKKYLQNIDALILMANALWRMSKLSESEQIIIKGENLLNIDISIPIIELERRRAILLSRKANIYGGRGDVDKALSFLNESLALSSKYDFKQEKAMCLNNIGHITYNKGELVKALNFHEQSLAIREQLGIKQDLALSIGNIGIVYHDMGQFDTALAYYERCLSLNREIGNSIHLSDMYYHLIWLFIDMNQVESAQKYLEEFEHLIKKSTYRLVQHRFLVSKALILKNETQTLKKAEAENLFRQIINENTFEHQLTVFAYFNLFELLIEEVQKTGEEELLEEVKKLAEKLVTITNAVNSYSYSTEIYILQSKLALVELKIDESKQLLTIAQLTAQKHNLRGLLIKATKELDLLVKQEEQWEIFQGKNTSLHERIELARLAELVKKMIYKKLIETPELEEENPVFPNINLNLNEVYDYLKLISESTELKNMKQK